MTGGLRPTRSHGRSSARRKRCSDRCQSVTQDARCSAHRLNDVALSGKWAAGLPSDQTANNSDATSGPIRGRRPCPRTSIGTTLKGPGRSPATAVSTRVTAGAIIGSMLRVGHSIRDFPNFPRCGDGLGLEHCRGQLVRRSAGWVDHAFPTAHRGKGLRHLRIDADADQGHCNRDPTRTVRAADGRTRRRYSQPRLCSAAQQA